MIEGAPEPEVAKEERQEEAVKMTEAPSVGDQGKGIMVIIKTRSGLSIQQRNLDYQGLKGLVEKLEGLC